MDEPHRGPAANDYDLIREYCSETFCRLCFSQIYELHRIFPPTGQPNRLLVKKVEFCTEIRITFAKDSNACICTKCIGLVEEFFRFKQLCSANEQLAKVGSIRDHVASGYAGSEQRFVREHNAPLESSASSSSLLTIDSEHVDASTDMGDTIRAVNSLNEPSVKFSDFVEESTASSNISNEVTSTGHCLRARKSTTRLASVIPAVAMTSIAIKAENDSDAESLGTDSPEEGEFSPETSEASSIEGTPAGSVSFTMVRGSKSRSNRRYLVYNDHRYSNPSNDGKVWRCTHRAPIYCRAVVILEKNRVIERNNHAHNHPPPNMSRRKRKISCSDSEPNTKANNNVKISLVLKKENNLPQRTSRSCKQSKHGDQHKWFIKANRKTVDGFTYTFCGLRKDGIIRMKCITKGCAGRIYMYSSGDVLQTNKEHCHSAHEPL